MALFPGVVIQMGLRSAAVVGGALVVVQESGVGSRATRWYSGNGAPPSGAAPPLQPPPAVGDFYLDRLTGQVYELSA
jgi:hypothetical protein